MAANITTSAGCMRTPASGLHKGHQVALLEAEALADLKPTLRSAPWGQPVNDAEASTRCAAVVGPQNDQGDGLQAIALIVDERLLIQPCVR